MRPSHPLGLRKPQHQRAELGGNKQTHTSPPPLPVGDSRVEESPAPLQEMGSRAHAVRGVPHGSPCMWWAHWGMASRLSFGLGPAGSREEQPGHQTLSDESRPQAWLQGGTPAPPYRATSHASIF
ncbi:hypothetical protein CRENBAI_021584 [Crenichthys baileyi]|uniref:Uncharacterized protein n=1 Tax=Crenichthys baileyi TaxID=28760 RepID=A0AAV9SPI4_9TELE